MEQTVRIDALTYGEAGIGRLDDGKAVFVPHTTPGDVVRIEVTEDKKTFAHARLLDIVEASPDRVAPACPYAGVCGGCQWMHVSYEAQLKAKRDNVVSALSHLARWDVETAEAMVAACVPSKRELGYRNKLELGAERDAQGRFTLGFRSESSHQFVSPDACLLAHKTIQKAPKALRGALRFLEGNKDLGIYRVGVRHSFRTGNVEVALWTPPSAFPRAQVANTLSSALKTTGIVRVLADPGKARKVKGVEVLAGHGKWRERLGDNEFSVSAPSFFQVNTEQADNMIDCVIEGLELDEDAVVADLYAGAGTFSLALSEQVDMVYAVESAASSVRDLRHNADANGAWIEVVGGDAAHELPELGALDALVVYPPRAGLAEGVPELIAAAGPERIAYVSCNPSTWARDVVRLEEAGYALASVTPLDLFPQTYHAELVSIFKRL